MESKTNTAVQMSPPWITFAHQVEALFGKDPAVRVEFEPVSDSEYVLSLYVAGADKADALTRLLPPEKQFGNIKVTLDIIPANAETDTVNSYRLAFAGNPAFSYIVEGDTSKGLYSFNYVVFKNEVVQFFNDDLSDINGNMSTLYQDIAKEVFDDTEGIYFCTDTPAGESKR